MFFGRLCDSCSFSEQMGKHGVRPEGMRWEQTHWKVALKNVDKELIKALKAA